MTAAAAFRCAGCGCEARRATIAAEDPRPVVALVFGWHADGSPTLSCASCRARLARRGRRRKAKP